VQAQVIAVLLYESAAAVQAALWRQEAGEQRQKYTAKCPLFAGSGPRKKSGSRRTRWKAQITVPGGDEQWKPNIQNTNYNLIIGIQAPELKALEAEIRELFNTASRS
jgi:hypothetical protein